MSTERRAAEHQDAGPSVTTPNRSTTYRARVKYLKADIDRMEDLVRAVEAGEQAVVEQQPAVQLPPEVGRHGKIKELRRQAEALVETLNSMVIADEQGEDSEGQGGGEAEQGEDSEGQGGGEAEPWTEESGQGGPGTKERGGQGGLGAEKGGGQGGPGAEEGSGQEGLGADEESANERSILEAMELDAEGGQEGPGADEESADNRSSLEAMELDAQPDTELGKNPSAPVDEDVWQSDHESDKDYEDSQSESDSEDSTTTESSKRSEPGLVQYETQGLDVRVQNNWPNLREDEKVQVLDKGIADLKRKLCLKKFRPEGQHRNNYEAVLDFMRAQRVVLAGAKRTPRLKKFTAIKMASSNPPSRKDLALFVAMTNGHSFRVQRRILRDEIAWIKEREIRAPQQGKTSRLQSILEDEGVQLAVVTARLEVSIV
jgi:hypothetical protein